MNIVQKRTVNKENLGHMVSPAYPSGGKSTVYVTVFFFLIQLNLYKVPFESSVIP